MCSSPSKVLGALARATALTSALAACGTLGDVPPSEAALPNRGVTPWTLVDILRGAWLSSWVFVPPATPALPAVTEPCALWQDGVHVFAAVRLGERAFIGRVASDDGLIFGDFETVLDAPGLRAPHVARDAAGRLHLVAAVAPDFDRIVHAAEGDDGIWRLNDAPWALAADGERLESPSLVFDADDAPWVYWTRSVDGTTPRVDVQRGSDASTRRAVLEGATGCTSPSGAATLCWDAGVARPDVRRATTAAGRIVYRMFYAGERGEASSIGFAAAFSPDGPFERYAFNPVLEADGRAFTAPSAVARPEDYALYVGLEGGRPGVMLAIDDAGAPSETW
jgi:hypothetical protein